MPKTKLTPERWKNHFHYGKYIYVAIIVVAAMLADVVFTMTAYRSPNARRVDIEFVGTYSEFLEEDAVFMRAALEAGQAYERMRDEAAGIDVNAEDYEVPLEVVEFLTLDYDPNGDDAYYGQQKYTVTLAAQEGDIFIVSRPLMNELVELELAVDLTPYIESGILDPGDRDMSTVTYDEYIEGQATGRQAIYAMSAAPMTGLLDEFYYVNGDKYMVIMTYCQNPDTAAAVMQYMMDEFTPTEEELAALEAAKAELAAEAAAEATEEPKEETNG